MRISGGIPAVVTDRNHSRTSEGIPAEPLGEIYEEILREFPIESMVKKNQRNA